MQAVIYVHTAYANPMLRIHQVAQCKQLAAEEDYHVAVIVADSESDGQQDRPGLCYLHTLIENDRVDALIAVDHHDLARQEQELDDFLTFCQSHNVEIRTVNECRDVLAERSVGA
jgi:DNA invertase Pin-like site-specific DNA recombinase